MALRADLEAAHAEGLIAEEQIGPLAAFLDAREAPAETPAAPAPPLPTGEEDLRFIRNFHDVFLSIGIVLVAIGMVVAILLQAGPDWMKSGGSAGPLWVMGALFAAGACALWALAEFFSRRRRLFLPSIALCTAFTGFVGATAAAFLFAAFTQAWSGHAPSPHIGLMTLRLVLLGVAVSATLAPLGFYWRFRLPFSLGLAGVAACWTLAALVFAIAPEYVMMALYPIMLAGGLALFALGIVFDARDPARATRLSDNGFWLHMAAAPLILNGAIGCVARILAPSAPAFSMLAGARGGGATMAAATLLIVALLALASLLINRRALIVSALLTTGLSVGVLLNAAGMGAGALAAATLLTLGAGVLVLGASWRNARRALLGWVPQGTVLARVFPPEALE